MARSDPPRSITQWKNWVRNNGKFRPGQKLQTLENPVKSDFSKVLNWANPEKNPDILSSPVLKSCWFSWPSDWKFYPGGSFSIKSHPGELLTLTGLLRQGCLEITTVQSTFLKIFSYLHVFELICIMFWISVLFLEFIGTNFRNKAVIQPSKPIR